MMNTKHKSVNTRKIGLVPSPGLAAQVTQKIADTLPTYLNKMVDDTVEWQPELIIDPIVGSAEYLNKLIDKLVNLKHKYDWDSVICITDLPHFMNKHVVVADVNIYQQIGLISIPAFGSFPIKKNVKQMTANILNDFQSKERDKTNFTPYFSFIKRYDFTNTTNDKRKLNEQTNDTQAQERKHTDKDANDEDYTQEDIEEKSDVRYIIQSKYLGQMKLLTGMTFANRPWNTLISLKKIIVFALGTGIYITIFPTPWELSMLYTLPRFITLMLVTILGMVIWIIFAHQLWEKRTSKGDPRLRKLYNYTTVTSLIGVMFVNYIILFCLFLATIAVFVPPGLFEIGTNLDGEPSVQHYFRLTWLITSLGTIAGSIGTTSENEKNIQLATYSYRQIARYNEIQKNDDNNN